MEIKNILTAALALLVAGPQANAVEETSPRCRDVVCLKLDVDLDSRFMDEQYLKLLAEHAGKQALLQSLTAEDAISRWISDETFTGIDKSAKGYRVGVEAVTMLSLTLGAAGTHELLKQMSPWLKQHARLIKEQQIIEQNISAIKRVKGTAKADTAASLEKWQSDLDDVNARISAHKATRRGHLRKIGRIANRAGRMTLAAGFAVLFMDSATDLLVIASDDSIPWTLDYLKASLRSDIERLEILIADY